MKNWTLVFGLGISGMAAVRYLKENDLEYFVMDDDSEAIEDHPPFLGNWEGCVSLVASPGIKENHPLLEAAKKQGIPILCDIALAVPHAPKLTIAVTGTAGKTTLVHLLSDILEASGVSNHMVGNCGTSPLDTLGDERDAWVVEISSAQARRLADFHPQIAIHLNLDENHLDWHPNFADYQDAKEALFAHQEREDHRLLGISVPVESMPGTATTHLLAGDYMTPHALENPQLFDETIEAAYLTGKLLDLDPKKTAHVINTFQPLPHRLERLETADGKIWINDSKATSPLATMAALDRIKSPAVLLMGGSEKELDYGELLGEIAQRGITLFPFGEVGERLSQEASEIPHLESQPAQDLEDCVENASLLPKGTTILLSPGTASFDSYTSYAQRGDHFKDLVTHFTDSGVAYEPA